MKKKVVPQILHLVLIFALVFLAACGPRDVINSLDTPTSGTIKVGVDDSYKLMMDAQLYTFQAMYKYARIDTVTGAEADIFELFMKDSLPLIVVNRKLTQEEEAYLVSNQFIPKTTKIAYDALAFIVNKENPDTTLFFDRIAAIF